MNIKEAFESALAFTIGTIGLIVVTVFTIVISVLPFILILAGCLAVVLYLLQFFGII